MGWGPCLLLCPAWASPLPRSSSPVTSQADGSSSPCSSVHCAALAWTQQGHGPRADERQMTKEQGTLAPEPLCSAQVSPATSNARRQKLAFLLWPFQLDWDMGDTGLGQLCTVPGVAYSRCLINVNSIYL